MTDFSRRNFLKTASAATLAALSMGAPVFAADKEKKESPEAKLKPTADSVILLWMGGAVGQTETFDPKTYTPFAEGLDPKKILSTFPQIDTAVDNIKFCAGLERMAKVMDRGALVRSYVARDYGAMAEDLQHIPFQYKWHTGYTTPSTVPAPYMGAWVSKLLGPLNPELPAFIEIGRSEKTTNVFLSLAAFKSSGFFGSEHGSLLIPDAARAGDIVKSLLPVERFDNRYKKFRELMAASPITELGSSYQKESLERSVESAYKLMRSNSVDAFDINKEPKEEIAKYDTGPFGRGCLLARRLVENRARFVEVHVDFENAKGWDTHNDGHNGQAAMKKVIDGPVSQLILDLEQRKLLDRTLVILATEFGRCALGRGGAKVKTITKMEHYGVHGHFSGASSMLMWGGGIKRGALYGKTNDVFPCETVEKPVSIADLHATIYNRLGISPKVSVDIEKRPFYVTKDGLGKAIPELLA